MANHDFGSPCNCIECRTEILSVLCPSCGFETAVSYVRGNGEVVTDRKGKWYYDFVENTEKGHTLNCFKCGFEIQDVSYYEKVEQGINQRKLEEKTCDNCGIKEYSSLRTVKYKEIEGKILCMNCFEKKIKAELLDPSTPDERYKLNTESLKYVLYEVRLPCVDCGRKRWVKENEQWKKLCLSCYKKQKIGY